MAEREKYPFGKPRPYSPDHPNLLLSEQAPPPGAHQPLTSGWLRPSLIGLAVLLVTYGAYGLFVNDLYLPGKRSPGTHYHGVAAFLIFMMLVSLATWIITFALGRTDSLGKQPANKRILKWLAGAGIVFMIAGIYMASAT